MGSGKKEHTYVTPPDMIADYNSSLGGVDLADMLIALYRTEIVSKKQWLISARSKVGSCIAVIVISRAFSKKKTTFRVYYIHSEFIATIRKDTFIWKTKEALLVTNDDSRKESRSTKTYA